MKKWRDLPPRMIRRRRILKSGKQWVGYYYDGRAPDGKRIEIPLGTDLSEAKVKWAELEGISAEPQIKILGFIFDRYEREIIPSKKPRTQKDNLAELKQLRSAFHDAPIDALTPQIIAQYRDARTAKTRGNREIALLSHIFNIAREWGYTEKENPCRGVRRNKEKPRDFYASADVWDAVYATAVPELKDAMDLAYLSGQRPADVLRCMVSDIEDGFLLVQQGKTSKKLRIRLIEKSGEPTNLGRLVNALLIKRRAVKSEFLLCNDEGLRISYGMLRNRWDKARELAANNARKKGLDELAAKVEKFRFSDIRPRAASDIEDITDASKLLGHSKEQITKTVYRRIGETVNPTR